MRDSRRIALVWVRWLEEKSDKILRTTGPYLRERGEDSEIQDHTIAALATVSPTKLQEKRKLLLEVLAKAKLEEAENANQNVANLIDQVNNAEFLNGRVQSLQALAKLNWASDERILQTIFKKLDRIVEWEIRVACADELHRMAPGDHEILDKFLKFVEKEQETRAKCQMALTLGTLKWASEKVTPYLIKLLEDKDPKVKRRAAIALGKLRASEELRTKAASIIAHDADISNLDWKEKASLAEGIGLLQSPDEQQIQIIFKLLADDNEEVKRVAGKALSQLNISS